jgi:prepilin-type N-terminal cleavage/methylation domain-containing protein
MKTAFTLVELIVVIAIIALLMALGLPAFRLASERAAETVCQSQLRQMADAMRIYCADHDGLFPPAYGLYHSQRSFEDPTYPDFLDYPELCRWHDPEIGPASDLFRERKLWQGALIPYIGNPRILLCKTGARANLERGCNSLHDSQPRYRRGEIPIVPQYTYTMNHYLSREHIYAGGWPTGSPMSPMNPRSVRLLGCTRESQVTRSLSEVFAFGEENSWAINPLGDQAGAHRWPAPYNLSHFGTHRDGADGPIVRSDLSIAPSYQVDGGRLQGEPSVDPNGDGGGYGRTRKPQEYTNVVRQGERLVGDAFATYHHPRRGDLNTGYSFVSMLDGHVRKVTVSDQLRKSRQVESVPPSRLGPGGNLHLAWPLDIPPLGGWENQ